MVAAVLLGAWASPAAPQAIDATTYPFTFGAGAALEDMSSGTTELLGPDLDNAASVVVPVGFEFWFAGTRYTSFSLSSNGLLKPGSVATQAAATNNLASILTAPQIAPYWDDLWIGTNGRVHHKVVGAAPNRKLVVEWLNMQVPRIGAGLSGAGTFQCWLHETTGKIEFVYGGGIVTNTTQGGASIGIGSPAGTFASVTSVSPSVAYGTANNANVTAIASGTRYTLTPAAPAAPTGFGFSQVSALAMTLGWTDNASNEVGYAIWRSTDGVNYEFVTQTAANTVSLAQTELTPSTTYHWIVRAVTEGALSDPVAGSQATGAAGAIVTAGSGNWSSTTPGAPWPGGMVPTSSDHVTIADGHTVTVNASASCYGLTVGQGASGVLRFEGSTARTLSVVGAVLISPSGVLASASSGTQAGHVLSIGGSLTNQGTLDLSTSGDLAGATLTFAGGGSASLTGAGPVTDVRAITASKSSGASLTLDAASFTVRGQSSDTLGFLTLTSGTFRLAGSFAMTSPVFTTASYTLPTGTTFWLDNPNFTVAPMAGSATVRGLRISAGVFQVGTLGDHSLQLANGSQVTVEGGEVRTAGRFAVSSTSNIVTYLQTGGAVTVNTVGNTSTSLASFDLGAGTTSSVTVSGGSIVIEKASTAASGPRDYRNAGATQNLTGGTLQLGNANTGAPRTYLISGTAHDLVVSNLSGGHTARLFAATTVVGSTTIASGATLDLNGFRFTQSTGSLVNDGTLTASAGTSELYFLGSVTPQGYSGAGAIPSPVAILSVDNPAGVSIDAGLAANVVTRRVNLIRGVLGNSQKITLGNADAFAALTEVGATGVTGTAGSYDTAPVFNPGTGGVSVAYLQEGTLRTSGFEIPPARQLRDLTVNNPGGEVIVSGGALTLTRGLTLTGGRLRTTGTDVVVLGDTASVIPSGSSQSYVDGPLAIAITTLDTVAVSRTFAVGRNGAFRPLVLSGVLTGGVQQVLTAEVLAGPTGGTPLAPLQALTGTRYWRIGNSAGLNAPARVRLSFGTDDMVGGLANLRVAHSGAADGSYADLGGSATGSPASGTVVSTADLTPGSDYFVVASAGTLASTWDGGAATSSWGDAANWSPDGVPDSTTDVTLTFASPTTLHAAGDFSVHSLTVNSNATLQVDSGSLAVTGDYAQIGGAVQLAGGALGVSGATSLSAGTLDLGSGTFTAHDDVTVSGGSLTLSSGTLLADSSLGIEGGTVSLGSGTLEVRGSFWRTSGSFFAGTGTTIFSGTATQDLGGSVTYYDLVLRNGGAGNPKRLQSFLAHTVSNDLTVEGTAQLALSAASATQLTVWGNLRYSGLTGGSSISSLTMNLAGIGKTISGVPALVANEALGAEELVTAAIDAPTVEASFVTDPTQAAHAPGELDGKPILVLENTYEKRKGTVEQLLRTSDPAKRLVINLDDVTLVRNAVATLDAESAASATSTATATLPMPVVIPSSARYALDGNLAMGSGRTLTLGGRLDCGDFTVGGAGAIAVQTSGVLGTTTASASGLAATVVTTGTNSYTDGAVIEYNLAGDQAIHAANHPAAALIHTAGSGTKTLSASKTITGSSGGFLSQGSLVVGAGTTFADGGNQLTFTTTQIANVIVQGTYLSTGTGSISYQAGATASNILAANGTAFGDLLINFASSTSSIDLNASGPANLSFRNITFGGTAGTGTAGGTLRFSETGTTNVTVTGNVSIAPVTTSNTGGGFGGTAGKSGQVTLLGNLTSTSLAATQPIVNGTGTNKLIFAGAARETLALAANTTLFTGSTLQLANPAGLQMTGSNRTYTIGTGGALDLGNGNLNVGTNTLAMAAGVPLSRTTGRVVGRLKKGFATGPASAAFEIGSETADTPISLAFGNVTVPGNIVTTTTGSEHPSISTSNLDPTRSVNRYYSISNEGVAFDTATVGLTFPAGEVDAGADPAIFAVRKFDSPSWTPTVIAQRTPTSIQAKRITSFSDFAIGEAMNYHLTASAGPNGSIAPSGSLLLTPGVSQAYTITPDVGHHVADVVVDGFSVGPVLSHTFSNLAADHTIAATFAINVYSIAASAGPGGTISPSGAVPVTHGASQPFSILPDSGYAVLDVLVDGVSIGAATSHTFSNVTEAHTIAATFTPTALFVVEAPATAISSAYPCVIVPVKLSRTGSAPVRGFSVRVTLSPELTLCAGTASITEGTYLSSAGPTSFQVTDNGAGVYTVDGVVLGAACGPTTPIGTLFSLGVKSSAPSASGTVALSNLKLRDCNNQALFIVGTDTATVQVDNTPPSVSVVSPNGGEVVTIDSTHVITWTATDDDSVATVDLSYSTDGGVTFPNAIASGLPNTGSHAWVVPNTRSTTARVRIVAHDVNANVASDTSNADFEIREANVPPVLAAIGNQTVSEGALLTFTAVASDPNLPAQGLAFSLGAGAPAGATIDSGTGVFTWTPTEAQGPGDYPVTVRVTDDGTPALADSETITVHVDEVNTPPVLAAIGSQSVAEGALLSFSAGASDLDLPAQTLRFSLATGAPSGAAIDSSGGAFTWTPTDDQGPGDYSLTVIVTDGGVPALADSETVAIHVDDLNTAPVLAAIGDRTISEGSALAFTASATDSDLPAQALTFSLDAGAPAGAAIDPGTGAFTWTPTEGQGPGDYPVTVRVTDDGVPLAPGSATLASPPLDDWETITIHVDEANLPPVLAAIDDQSVAEDSLLTFTAAATDPDLPAQTLTFSLDAGSPAGAIIDPSTGIFTWTPTEAQGPGDYSITVRVTDSGGAPLDDADTLTIHVDEVNMPPLLSGVPVAVTIAELVLYSFAAAATDPDLPAQTLTFSTIGAPAGASIDPGTGAFDWSPSEAQGPGSYPFSVRVTDGVTNTDAGVTLTVGESNAAPVLAAIGNQSVNEAVLLSFTASATDADDPPQTLTYTLDAGAPAGAAIDPSSGAFTWTPTEAQGPGDYPVTVRVTDDGAPALDDSETLSIHVDELNTPPGLSGVPATATIPELALYGFTASATDADLPAQTLTFSLVGAPAGASIDPGTGAFTWTPSETQGGASYPFTVRVSDGFANTDSAITLTVDEVNSAPVLAAIGDQTVSEGSLLTFTASATDGDVPPQALTYSLDAGAPVGAAIDPGTGAFSWTPTETQGPGDYPVTVRVTDDGSPALDDSETLTIHVNENNTPPMLSGVPATATIPELALYGFTASASDADVPAQTLTFSLVGAPAGASIDPGTGAFTWTPSEAQGPGAYPFSVRVSDGIANTDAAITLTVDEVNSAPVLAAIGDRTVGESSLLTFTASATDSDLPVQTLTYSLDAGAPAGAAIDPGTGVFTWTPTEAQGPGDYPVTVRVTDDGAPVLDDSETINVHVDDVNTPPALSDVPATATIPELVEYGFTASAIDTDLPAQPLTFSLVGAPAGASIHPTSGLFAWTPSEAQGPGSYPFTVRVSDGIANTDSAITITVNDVSIAAIADLAAAKLGSGNDADGTTQVTLTWSPTAEGTTVETFRAPYGSYPEYDDAGGQVPAAPSYPPGPPWVLTSVTASGTTDEPSARDFYYYVAFVHGAGLNVSAVSNLTAGALNYHLGDVSDAVTAGQGDNAVNTADISLLGAHYGLTGVAVAPYNYLDVGPTTDFSTLTRPTTDDAIDFEDLILFAIGFDVVSAPLASARPVAVPAAMRSNALFAVVPDRVTANETVTVPITLSTTGVVQGLSATLEWDSAVVRPISVAAGEFMEQAGGIVLSPRSGVVDAAFLGVLPQGIPGEGVIATVTFEVIAAGDPRIRIASIEARDAANHAISIPVGIPPRPRVIPAFTSLGFAGPNPFRENTAFAVGLAQSGPVDLVVYSVTGRRVRTLLAGAQEAGEYRLVWDGRDDRGNAVAAGVYYARLSAGGRHYSRPVVNLR